VFSFSLRSRLTGEEFIRSLEKPGAAALELIYRGDEIVRVDTSKFGSVTTHLLSDRQAEIVFHSWDGDGVITVSADPESGDILVEPSAYSSRPGVRGCRWNLTGLRAELELVAPAVTALVEIVHDPDMVLKTKLTSDQIEREADGTVVVVDGYQRTPVAEWAKTLPAWMQKQPRPQGSGAPSGQASSSVPTGMKNPFNRETFNLTEQARLFKTDRDLYDRMKATGNR